MRASPRTQAGPLEARNGATPGAAIVILACGKISPSCCYPCAANGKW